MVDGIVRVSAGINSRFKGPSSPSGQRVMRPQSPAELEPPVRHLIPLLGLALVAGCSMQATPAIDIQTLPDADIDASIPDATQPEASLSDAPGPVVTPPTVLICEACDSDIECGAGSHCVEITTGQRLCLPQCDIDIPDCPRSFHCVSDFSASVGSPICVPIGERCCVDEDGDGFGEGAGCDERDCGDLDPDVHPGAPERCNGLDDDCDTRIDEEIPEQTCGEGACARVAPACEPGGLVPMCIPGMPSDELCNGLDDDCDTLIDEDASVGCPEAGAVCSMGACTCPAGTRSCPARGACIPDDECCTSADCDRPPPCHTGGTCAPATGECAYTPDLSCVGCRDGSREGFTNVTQHPRIAGCAATWQRSVSHCPADLDRNLDAARRAPQYGCSACAPGWEVCGSTPALYNSPLDAYTLPGGDPGEIRRNTRYRDCKAQPGWFAGAANFAESLASCEMTTAGQSVMGCGVLTGAHPYYPDDTTRNDCSGYPELRSRSCLRNSNCLGIAGLNPGMRNPSPGSAAVPRGVLCCRR